MVMKLIRNSLLLIPALLVLSVSNSGVVLAKSMTSDPGEKNTFFVSAMNKGFGTKDIRVSYSLSAVEVFARQFLSIQYQLDSNDSFITLAIDYQNIPGEGMIPLIVEKQKSGQPGFKYHYVFNVKYYTTRTGKQKLFVPSLLYSEGGKIKYRFNFKPRSVMNKALPPYLPPYIPVGNIELESDFPQSESWLGWYDKDKIYYWNIYLHAKNVTPDVLPEIRQQLVSNRNIKFLPAEIIRKTVKGVNNINRKIHYSIPFVPVSSGQVTMPVLQLQSFNTQTRQLNNQHYSFDTIYVLHPYVQWLVDALIFILVVFVFGKLLPPVMRVSYHLRVLVRARKQIKLAATTVQLRRAMTLLAKAFNWPENQSVERWMGCWFRDIEKTENADAVINPINTGLYSSSCIQADSFNDAKQFFQQPVLRQYLTCFILAWKQKK